MTSPIGFIEVLFLSGLIAIVPTDRAYERSWRVNEPSRPESSRRRTTGLLDLGLLGADETRNVAKIAAYMQNPSVQVGT
jgi:hypothetical protein